MKLVRLFSLVLVSSLIAVLLGQGISRLEVSGGSMLPAVPWFGLALLVAFGYAVVLLRLIGPNRRE